MAHPPAPARAPDARLVSKLEPVLAVASFAAFPVVQLLAVNAGQSVPADAPRSLAISVLLGIFILSAAGVATGTCFQRGRLLAPAGYGWSGPAPGLALPGCG